MDGLQFDHLARKWRARRSRRTATGVLGGVLAAQLLAPTDLAARNKEEEKEKEGVRQELRVWLLHRKTRRVHPTRTAEPWSMRYRR